MLNYIYDFRYKFNCFVKNITPLQISIFLNIIILLPFLFTNTMKFETSDDFIMELIVSGAYDGTPTPQIMFMNIIIGYLLAFLYRFCLNINWYTTFQIFIIFCSMITVSYYILKKETTILGVIIVFIILCFCSVDLYSLIQFTKTSGIAITAGSIVILDYILNDCTKIHENILFIGVLFIEIGMLIRKNTLYIVIPFLLLTLIYYIFFNKCFFFNKVKMYKIFTVFLCIFTCFMVNSSIERFYQNSHPSYKEFKDYSRLRANIVDYPHPDYYLIQNSCEIFGITELDYLTFLHWNFGDTQVFSKEKLTSLNNILKDYHDSKRRGFKDTFFYLFDRNYQEYILVWGVLLITIVCFFYFKNVSKIFVIFISMTYLLLYALLYRGRLVFRVESVIFTTLLIFLSCVFLEQSKKNANLNKKFFIIILTLLLLFRIPIYIPESSNMSFNYLYSSSDNVLKKYRASFNDENRQNNLLKEIIYNKNNYYCFGFQTCIQSFYLNFDALKPIPMNVFYNSIYLSGVDTMHPTTIKKLTEKQVINSISLLTNRNVYLIENYYTDEIVNFINQRSNKKVFKELYKEIDGYQIWKIRYELTI